MFTQQRYMKYSFCPHGACYNLRRETENRVKKSTESRNKCYTAQRVLENKRETLFLIDYSEKAFLKLNLEPEDKNGSGPSEDQGERIPDRTAGENP